MLALAFLVPSTLLAHGGRTNAEGCHNNRKTGEYQCHTKKAAKKAAPKTARTAAKTQARLLRDDKNCGDFATQKAAQLFYISQGGPTEDPHDLDRDNDGIACENNK
ncbi:MAG: excalibur calcium-binding domain-containing protein [Candidatus Pacebacteria bacterium]|nr:excalibur calcium-binding domain-containing protein [Candidatus Paceibacterota bacterium]